MARSRNENSQYPEGAAVVDRLQEAYGVTTLQGLAERLAEGESTVKNWRYRGSVPMKHLVTASKDTKRSIEWLLTGAAGVAAKAPRELSTALEDGAVVRASLLVSEPGPPVWLAESGPVKARAAVKTATPRSRGARRQGMAPPEVGALLPVPHGTDVHPLVLSLAMGDQGATLNYEVIPRLVSGADQSAATSQLDRAGELAMSFQWLGRHLFHTTGDLASVQVVGDSMSPTLLDGETIIIDRGVREVVVDDIYVVDMLGQRLVKRLQRKTDGSLVIISDNQAYERESVPRNRVGELAVVGRKVWPRTR